MRIIGTIYKKICVLNIFYFGVLSCSNSFAQEDIDAKIDKWANAFEPSTLSLSERKKELRWFAQAAKEFKGKSLKSTAEDIKTHYWERDILTTAFEDITGIKVTHEIIGEGALVDRLVEQLQTGRQIYDIYVNDADLIGWHLRNDAIVDLTDYMKKDGKKYTNPNLDLKDFIGLDMGKDYDGHILQLPDQQFANLYWFRADWFNRADLKQEFKKKYGYELGVPINWKAYEDIAKFFTGRTIDGVKVYGHIDYYKKSPSLGWRFTDAWLSMAGVGDKGLPNGSPVDEWGIRAEKRIPVGSSVDRGGEANGPSAVYALSKYLEWYKYAPPESKEWTFSDEGGRAAKGDIAQSIFQYITFLSEDSFKKPGSPVVGKDGKPLWRVASSPHGKFWQQGMKIGYQDCGSWTIPKSTKGEQRAMAWLWAQFAVSKTASLKKFIVGGTPIRKSTIFSKYLTNHIDEYGGLIEFYRSPQEKLFTDTGKNVPDYPAMSKMWWPNIARANDGELTPQQAMDEIAKEQDELMAQSKLVKYRPKLVENPKGRSYWLDKSKSSGAPWPDKPEDKPKTLPYAVLLKEWK